MSPDEPFDHTAAESGSDHRGGGSAPGRRAPRGSSRARDGGAARPMGSSGSQVPPAGPTRIPTGAKRPGRSGGGSGATAAPPSFRPGGEEPAGGRTRVMPEQGGGRSVRSAAGNSSSRRPPDGAPGELRQTTATRQKKPQGAPAGRTKRRRPLRRAGIVLALMLALMLAWPVGLLIWANSKIQHVDALSGSAGTSGTTYLLAGSDSREDGTLPDDPTEGARTDTIMLLHVPRSGTSSLISLPRDTYVEIPGQGGHKLNSAYTFGGPVLLVETVEALTGIDVDHYVEVGMGGVADLVDAVGGVELCLDYDVDDSRSNLQWEAGCHVVDGETALSFARMRYADPLGDIGRTQRQQQLIQAVTGAAADPGLVFRPGEQISLLDAGVGALSVSDGTNIIDLGRMALAFRDATGENGVRGTPPIASLDYRPGGNIGSTVLLDADLTPAFWAAVADGSITDADVDGD